MNDYEELAGSRLWEAFDKEFLHGVGMHLLGLGQTRTGKTQKAYQIVKWQLKRGDTIVWFDSGKSGEILPLCDFGKPINVITPAGTNVEITGCKNRVDCVSPLIERDYWNNIKKGAINIFSYRRAFRDVTDLSRYGANLVKGLVDASYDEMPLPTPLSVHIDEFAAVCPSEKLMENQYQKSMASRVSLALKNLGSMGIKICAYDQNWKDIYPNARRQFPFLMVCRSPGLGIDSGLPDRYRNSFSDLKVDQAQFIFPWREWKGYWHFKFFPQPEGLSVRYSGQVLSRPSHSKKRVVETWQKVMVDDAA
jgi:hypothetical protein